MADAQLTPYHSFLSSYARAFNAQTWTRSVKQGASGQERLPHSTARRNFAGLAKFRGLFYLSRKVRVCVVACGRWYWKVCD